MLAGAFNSDTSFIGIPGMGGPGVHKPNAGSLAFLSSRQATPPPPSQQAMQPLDNAVTEELGYTASAGKVEMVVSGQKSGEMVTLLLALDKKLHTEPDKLQLAVYHLRVHGGTST